MGSLFSLLHLFPSHTALCAQGQSALLGLSSGTIVLLLTVISMRPLNSSGILNSQSQVQSNTTSILTAVLTLHHGDAALVTEVASPGIEWVGAAELLPEGGTTNTSLKHQRD